MGVLVILVLIAAIVWIIFLQTQARKQSKIHTSQGRMAVQQVVDEVFGKSWNRVKGPGHINLRPKMRAHAPTISIDVDPGSKGGSDVGVWMSAFGRRYGVIAHAQLVWRKERQLVSRLGGAVGQNAMGAGTPSSGGSTSSRASAPAKSTVTDGTKSTNSTGAGSRNNGSTRGSSASAESKSALVCKLVAESEYSFIVRSPKSPREIAAAVETSFKGVQRGPMDHLLIGPPRATMWAYILESENSKNMLAISLVTKENPDRDFIEHSVQMPLRDSVLKAIDGELEIRTAGNPLGDLREEILRTRLVPVSEYSD